MNRSRGRLFVGLLFASPFLLGFLIFTVYPILASFFFSLCDYNAFNAPIFNYGKNYRELFRDDLFLKACWNTLIFTVFSVPITMFVALALALLLNLKVRGQAFYRTLFFLPSIVPVVASSVLWIWVFNPQYGILNVALRTAKPYVDPFLHWLGFSWNWAAIHLGLPLTVKTLALDVPGWLTDPQWAKTALIIMSVWGMGGNMILYLAGLQEVPQEQYEAAEIDGASAWQRTWSITFPMISPILFFTLIMGLIGTFQYFTQAWIMTSGGPADSTLFYALYLFNNAFLYFRMGYASAMAWIMFLGIILCTVLIFRSSRRFVHYQGV